MSFILDALRRADAERQRERGPDLQQVADGTALRAAAPAPDPRRHRLLVGVGSALGLAALALGGWMLGRAPGAGRPLATAASAPSITAPATPAPTAVDTPAPPTPGAAGTAGAAGLSAPPAAPAPQPLTPAAAGATGAAGPAPATVAPVAAGNTAAAASTPSPAGTLATGVAPPPPAASSAVMTNAAAASAPAPVVLQGTAALPEPWRSRVAALRFSGGVHSADRSQSFVLLGAALVHEGDAVAPEVVVDRIGPRSLRLRAGPHLVELPL